MRALEEEETRRTRGRNCTFSDADLTVGDTVYYANDEGVAAKVVGEKKVRFEDKEPFGDEEISLSKSALLLLQRDGYKWRTVNGWQYWMFEGETIAGRIQRLREEEEQADTDE